ncbi:MAG: ABC transporter substrate-binding protein [Eggerthellaceae bacterium]|nr:ABC transporter substrate-binding protein [Eggerthellaceae bacterium]
MEAGSSESTQDESSTSASQEAGASAEQASADATSASQVVVAIPASSEPEAGFDPFFTWGCGEHVHEPLIQSTLIRTNVNLEFENDLATSYETSDDGLTWTFTIRDDVVFSDGEPLTAADVAFTLNGIKASEGSECDLSFMDEAVATSDTTVEIKLNKPFNALLYQLANIGIVPEHAYSSGYGSNPIGSGRYMLEQWDRGQQAIFVANPNYYGDTPKIERVVVLFAEEDAAYAAVNSSQVDLAWTSATLADTVPAGFTLLSCNSVDSRGISLPVLEAGGTKEAGDSSYNTGNDVTSDLAVRKAINYGIDRDVLVEHVMNGHGTVAYSVGDGMPWASEDMKVNTDVEAAKQFMEDGGWTLGSDGVYEKDGTRAAFDLYYSASDSVRQAIAEEVKNQLAEVGIEVTPVGSTWTEDGLYGHQYTDPVVWGWGSNAPIEIYNIYHSAGNSNAACYSNETTDAHIEAALAAPRVEESYELWQQAYWDGAQGPAPQGDAAWVWLANIDHLYFVKDGLTVAEQKPHPHGHGWSILNNVDEWTW